MCPSVFILFSISFHFCSYLTCDDNLLWQKDVDISKSHNLTKELRSPLGVKAMKVAEP